MYIESEYTHWIILLLHDTLIDSSIPEYNDVLWFPLLRTVVKVEQQLPVNSRKSLITLMLNILFCKRMKEYCTIHMALK